MAKAGHNSKAQPATVAGQKIKSYVDRVEKLEEERKAIGGDIRDVYAEAKGNGYDVKTLRWLVQERRIQAVDRDERDALRDTYKHALDMAVHLVQVEGLSLREAAKRTGTNKSSVHRALAVPHVSQETQPEDGDDGITDAAGRDPGIEGESDDAPDDLRVSEADRSTDGGHGQSASGGQGVQRRAGCLPAGGAGQDVCDQGASVQRDVGERGDHATAGRDAARLTPALDIVHNEVQPSAPVSVGAVASESESERVASSSSDLEMPPIPDFLRRQTEAGV